MVKSKVSRHSGERKIIEVPKAVRDDFDIGEEVEVRKVKNERRKVL